MPLATLFASEVEPSSSACFLNSHNFAKTQGSLEICGKQYVGSLQPELRNTCVVR